MVESRKKLTVSYGAFSCTLEGFDDPFPVMKQVVDYFQNLADRDPSFGAHPERPDTDYLRNLAQRSAGIDEVEVEVHEGGVTLRQPSEAGQAFAGMEVVEETIVVTPSAFQHKAEEDREVEEPTYPMEVADSAELPGMDVAPELSAAPEDLTEDLAEASEVADLIGADALPEGADEEIADIDEMAELHADMEQFDIEPLVDTSPVAAELPEILKNGSGPVEDVAPVSEDYLDISNDELAATEREATEAALDTGDAEPEEQLATENETAATEEPADKPAEKTGFVSKLPGWAADLIRPAGNQDAQDTLDVVDFGNEEAEDVAESAEMNGSASQDAPNPEDAALERLLKITESRRSEPDASADTDALSEIREGILSSQTDTDDEETLADVLKAGSDFDISGEMEGRADEDSADISDMETAMPETTEAVAQMTDDDAPGSEEDDQPAEVADSEPTQQVPEDSDGILEVAVLGSDDGPETGAQSAMLEKPKQVLAPLKLTPDFKVAEVAAEDEAPEEDVAEATEEITLAEETGEPVLDDVAQQDDESDKGNFRLVHDSAPAEEEALEMPELGKDADSDLSLVIFAKKVGAASLPELLEASAAYTTIVGGQTRFSRRSIMGMLDEMHTEARYSQEARIKSFGKLIRSGTILRVEDGQFAISRSAKFSYETKIGA